MERQLSLIHILFSNQVLREFFLPELKKAAAHITVPWIFHSDGNLLPALEDLSTLGMSGLHPLEPGAMNLKELKEKWGKRLCLVGNVDIDHCMTDATPEEIDEVVQDLSLIHISHMFGAGEGARARGTIVAAKISIVLALSWSWGKRIRTGGEK